MQFKAKQGRKEDSGEEQDCVMVVFKYCKSQELRIYNALCQHNWFSPCMIVKKVHGCKHSPSTNVHGLNLNILT